MSQASDPDEFFEVTGNELRPVIGDNSGFNTGILFHGRLDDDFNLSLGHRATQLPMEHGSGPAVQDRTQIKEGAGNVDVRDIDMPMFMRLQGLKKPRPLLEGLAFQRCNSPAWRKTR